MNTFWINKNNLLLLGKYSLSGAVAVLVDVAALTILRSLGLGEVLPLMVAILLSSLVHYTISRYWVFRSRVRSFFSGYVHFIGMIGISAILNSIIYLGLITVFTDMHIELRVFSIAVAGLLSFLLNTHLTFKHKLSDTTAR